MKCAFYALLFNMAFILALNVNAQDTYRNQLSSRMDNDQYIDPYNDRYYMAGNLLNFTTVLNSGKDCASLLGGGVAKKTLELEVASKFMVRLQHGRGTPLYRTGLIRAIYTQVHRLTGCTKTKVL